MPIALTTMTTLSRNFSLYWSFSVPCAGLSSHQPLDCPGLSPPVLSVYIHFVADLIWSCGFKYHWFTDDSQVYISIRDFSHEWQTLLSNHLLNIPTWMPNSHIKPSMSQNQLLSLSSMATLLFRLLKPEAKTLVSFLTRLSHKLYPIHQQTLLTHLQNIPRIQLVPASTAATLIWPPSSCSDYCKSFSLVSLLLPLPVPLSIDSQLVPTARLIKLKPVRSLHYWNPSTGSCNPSTVLTASPLTHHSLSLL